ncbi:MAG: site-2 protease family protein, partial [Planctomycetota bacterium]
MTFPLPFLAELSDVDLGVGLLWYVAFLLSAVLHEASHAWTAWKLGDSTAYHAGQVSLDPIPHIRREPIGMIVIPILSLVAFGYMFGWASAPYRLDWADRYPRRVGLMALAGPLSNLALAAISALIIALALKGGHFVSPRESIPLELSAPGSPLLSSIATFLGILLTLNLLLFIFNLLPVPPFDGCAVVQIFLPERIARSYQRFVR